MPKDYARTSRIGEALQRELSVIIQKEMRDPRLGMISILDVVVTKDLQQAKVYFSLLDDSDEHVAEATKTLNEAAGFLRSQIAKKVKLRTTPKLHFFFDDTLQKGNKIYKLLEENSSSSSSDADQVN